MPDETTVDKLPCCPSLDSDDSGDAITIRYRLDHPVDVRAQNRTTRVDVEVSYHVRISRSTAGTALGDLLYSTTLLPGEKVRIATRDASTRFQYDSETELASHAEQSSDEQSLLSDIVGYSTDYESIREGGQTHESHGQTRGSGSTSGAIETLLFGADASAKGEFDSHSTHTFLDELRGHVRGGADRAVEATRTRRSMQISEVSVHSRAQGQSEAHYEAHSRVFENKNPCRAVTYLFHRINKKQVIRAELEAITRRVVDPGADTKLAVTPPTHRLAPATATMSTNQPTLTLLDGPRAGTLRQPVLTHLSTGTITAERQPPLPASVRERALATVDRELVGAKIAKEADGGLVPSNTQRKRFEFELQTSIPTPGVLVRACLDECTACDPIREEMLKLEMERKALENQLLMRQIELLDKHHDYRCCPSGEGEEPGDPE